MASTQSQTTAAAAAPPTIHLVRHAQGFHNLSVANHALHDPLLTELGAQQCAQLRGAFPDMGGVELVVASPLKRALQTALLAFAPAIAARGLRVVALPELQDTSELPCDTGSDAAELRREFASRPVDWHLVDARPDWTLKSGDWAPWADPIVARARRARRWLRARPERCIAVVTHGGFLHYFTEDFDGYNAFNGTGWANAEFRSYTFDASRAEYASFAETAESRRRRGGGGSSVDKPLSDAEQHNLRQTAEKSWQQSGYKTGDAAAAAAAAAVPVQSKV